jgi:hypothetical protein
VENADYADYLVFARYIMYEIAIRVIANHVHIYATRPTKNRIPSAMSGSLPGYHVSSHVNKLKQRFSDDKISPLSPLKESKLLSCANSKSIMYCLLTDWFSGDSGYYEESQCVL